MVKCRICGRKFFHVTNTHLKTHSISINEYKDHFPNSLLVSKRTRDKNRENFIKSSTGRPRPDMKILMETNNPMKNPEIAKKQGQTRKDLIASGKINGQVLMQRINNLPSDNEKLVIDIFKNLNFPLKYVGDGSLWIGNHNPDFINEELKIAVELDLDGNMSRKHWNKQEEREKDFLKYGYKLVYLISKDEELIKEWLSPFFMGPKWIRIKSIKRISYPDKYYVYNFECKPGNNYFANRILVHNCFSYFFKSNNPTITNLTLRPVNVQRMIKALEGKPVDRRNRTIYEHFYKKKFLLHWGGLADPFCNFEVTNRIGYPLMEALGELNYPTLFSFKGKALLKPLYEKLFEKYSKQKNFAFQISMVTASDKQAKEIEIGVPAPSVRLKIIKILSDMGYWCLDKNTEVFHKVENSPQIRKSTLETLYKTGNSILVNCNGAWKKAKPIRIPYDDCWYKITLRNGSEITEIDKHLNFTFEGIKKGENIKEGDYLLVSNKSMNWDCDRGSYELGRFIGFWIAEGCYINENGIKFTFNSNEVEYIKFVVDFSKKLGGGVSIATVDNYTDVCVYSPYLKQLVDYFVSRTNLCSTIEMKEICYSMSRNFRKGVFNGWVEGDGNDKLQIYSISKNLLKDMFVLANTLGIKCSLGDNFLQACDVFTKNAKVYKINANTGINHSIYSKVVKVEKFYNRRFKFAYCLEVPDGNRFELANGIITHNCILRLRPFIIGITDDTIDELLAKALEAGIKGVSMEFFAMDARANEGMRLRYKWLGNQIGVGDKLMEFFGKVSPNNRGGYRRLNRDIKEEWAKRVFVFCQKNNLVFGCSDPDFKELNTSGSCCAMPDHYPENPLLENWTRNQLTYHLKEARKEYHLTGKKPLLYFDKVYPKSATYLNEPMFRDDHVGVIGLNSEHRKAVSLHFMILHYWLNTKSPANPMNYFDGKLHPVKEDSKGYMVYEYVPSPYEETWVEQGIDLRR